MNKEKLIEQLQRQEGLRLNPYKCSAGKLTIGYGRNLEAKGISKPEACMMLGNDIHECIDQVTAHISFFDSLNDARQNVLLNMCLNLGIYGLLGFKRFLRALEFGSFERAKDEMLDSKWAKQVGIRSEELAEQILTGEFACPYP